MPRLRKSLYVTVITAVFCLLNCRMSYAQIPEGQDAGAVHRSIEKDRERKDVRERLEKKRVPAVTEKEDIKPSRPDEFKVSERKVLIILRASDGRTPFASSL